MIKYFKLQFYYFTSERFPNLFRPSSKPFISGDTFRLMADHIFDESKSFDPKNVNKGDVIFLMSELCEIFFKTHHPYIQKKYILITHNSFKNISKEVEIYIDEKIIHWYVLNLELKNSDKYSLIPYGLENLKNFKYGRKKWFIKNDKLKKNLILSSFSSYSNYPIRSKIENILKDSSLVESKIFFSTEEYFDKLKESYFVICPPGKGNDTSRIWESLIFDTFPIFVTNNFTNNLKTIGVPGIYLEKWEDILSFDKDMLKQNYDLLIKKDYDHFLSYEFWSKKIKLDN